MSFQTLSNQHQTHSPPLLHLIMLKLSALYTMTTIPFSTWFIFFKPIYSEQNRVPNHRPSHASTLHRHLEDTVCAAAHLVNDLCSYSYSYYDYRYPTSFILGEFPFATSVHVDTGLWTHPPVCTETLPSIGAPLCVFTNASFSAKEDSQSSPPPRLQLTWRL